MKKIITSALLCLSFMSFAQQKELTLKDAIRYALENKADAEKARLEVTKSEYKIQEVRANALPNISASGGMVYNLLLRTGNGCTRLMLTAFSCACASSRAL